MIFLFIALPLVVAGLLPLLGRLSKRVLPDALANAVLLFLLVESVLMGKQLAGSGPYVRTFSWLGEPVNLRLAVDGFSLFMLFTVSLVGLCAGIFSIDYMKHYGAKANYWALFLVMIAGMNGLVLSADLFNVYIFLEVAAVASYALVAFGLESDELEAAFKYLMLSVVASAFVLIAIAVLFGVTGDVSFAAVARGLQDTDSRWVVAACSALFICGFGLKAALMPFHAWLPDAHPSAPAPISAMLSGLLIKVSGVYALTRIFFNVFGLTPALSTVLMGLATLSMVAAAFLALGQKDLKRMLAYSSISQVGYIVLGLGLGTPARDRRRALPPHQPRPRQGPPVLEFRLRPAGHRHEEPRRDGRPGQADAGDGGHEPGRGAVDRRRAAAQRLLEQAHHHHRPGPGRPLGVRPGRRPGQRPDALVLPAHPAQGLLRQAQ